MFGKMLIKGGIIVAGVIASQAVIEKLERNWLKRETKSKVVDSKEKVNTTINDKGVIRKSGRYPWGVDNDK